MIYLVYAIAIAATMFLAYIWGLNFKFKDQQRRDDWKQICLDKGWNINPVTVDELQPFIFDGKTYYGQPGKFNKLPVDGDEWFIRMAHPINSDVRNITDEEKAELVAMFAKADNTAQKESK